MQLRKFAGHRLAQCISLIGGIVLVTATFAQEFKLGDIQISHPFARTTVAQQTSGGAYLELENKGKTEDKLIKIESGIASSVEIHTMEMVGDIMKMREVDGITLKPGNKISMKPGGGYHIMLIGLNRQLKAGDQFPLTLTFAKAGKIDVVVHVNTGA
jgi:hypothetical protein